MSYLLELVGCSPTMMLFTITPSSLKLNSVSLICRQYAASAGAQRTLNFLKVILLQIMIMLFNVLQSNCKFNL